MDAHDAQQDVRPSGDPWQAFCYILTGVILYGGLGWLADRWMNTSFLVLIGILLGAGLGIFLVFTRFGHHPARGEQLPPAREDTA